MLDVVSRHGHQTERRDQDRHERKDADDVQDAPLLGIVGFDFLLDILRPGKDRTVGNTFEYRFDRIVGRGFVPADFDQDIPGIRLFRNSSGES